MKPTIPTTPGACRLVPFAPRRLTLRERLIVWGVYHSTLRDCLLWLAICVALVGLGLAMLVLSGRAP